MSEDQSGPTFLTLPVELRVAIYEELFAQIQNDLSVQSAVNAAPLLAICRQICLEATPILRRCVEARSANLEESVGSHDFSMKAASSLSEYAINAIKAGRFRMELGRFHALLCSLKRLELMVRQWK